MLIFRICVVASIFLYPILGTIALYKKIYNTKSALIFSMPRTVFGIPPECEMLQLPMELQNAILKFLDIKHLMSLSLVTKNFRKLILYNGLATYLNTGGQLSGLGLPVEQFDTLLKHIGHLITHLHFESINEKRLLRYVSYCPNLKHLKINYLKRSIGSDANRLEKIINKGLFRQLISLHLTNSDLDSNESLSLSKLTDLKSLNLTSSRIGLSGAKVIFKNLLKLNKLNFSYSNGILSGETQTLAPYLENLKELRCFKYNHHYIKPGCITEFNNVTAIITSLSKNIDWQGHRILTSLQFKNCSIDDEKVKDITKNLPQLTSLDLEGNSFTSLGIKYIDENLSQLTYLNVSKNRLTSKCAQYFSKHLLQLTYLDLSNNPMDCKNVLKIIQNLKNLNNLNLSFIFFKYNLYELNLIVDELLKLKNLSTFKLNFSCNPKFITEMKLIKIKLLTTFPNCIVELPLLNCR